MKTLFVLLLSLITLTVAVNAQHTFTITDATPSVKFVPAAVDSLYTSTAKTFVFKLTAEKGPFDYVVQYSTTQVRGTAAYTAKLEESHDGTNYVAINNANNDVNSGGGNYTYAWRSAVDTAMITCRYVKLTLTPTSASQKSTMTLNATFIPKKFR